MPYTPTLPPFSASDKLSGVSPIPARTVPAVPVVPLRTASPGPGRSPSLAMPPGVRLISWNLKDPPVAIETCAVVIGTALFARTTLEQLRIAIEKPTRWVGWTVPQLVDRLAQVGVVVALEPSQEA